MIPLAADSYQHLLLPVWFSLYSIIHLQKQLSFMAFSPIITNKFECFFSYFTSQEHSLENFFKTVSLKDAFKCWNIIDSLTFFQLS